MKNVLILISIVFISAFMMCCKVDKSWITDDDIAWFRCYDNKDTLVFKSEYKTVKLIVDTIFTANPQNDNPFDWEGMSAMHYFNIDRTLTGHGNINLKKAGDVYSPQYLHWASLTIDSSDYGGSHGALYAIVGDLIIIDHSRGYRSKLTYLGKEHKDRLFKGQRELQVFNVDDGIERANEDSITEFVWSRNRGLLSFTVRDTAVYRLVERHPAQ